MDELKLEKLIQELESHNDEENAYFGIQQYGGSPDESFVQGNKEGLIRFAKELLKASIKTEETDGKVIYLFDDDDKWIDDMSEVGIHYAEKVDISNDFLMKKSDSDNHNFIRVGCLLLFVGIITLIIIGIVTVVGWL